MLACGLVFAASALAQSGRKQKKAEVQPPPQGVNQPETRTVAEPEIGPEKPKEKEKEKGPAILVSSGMPDLEIPNFYADTAREACANEFRRELKTLEVRQERNQNRSDAMDSAKNEDNTYVVWIELSFNRMGGGTMNGLDMRYTVFEPKTARIAGSGFGFPTQPMGMPVPPLGASRDQVYVDWAGRDIAQQVIKRLNLRNRP